MTKDHSHEQKRKEEKGGDSMRSKVSSRQSSSGRGDGPRLQHPSNVVGNIKAAGM